MHDQADELRQLVRLRRDASPRDGPTAAAGSSSPAARAAWARPRWRSTWRWPWLGQGARSCWSTPIWTGGDVAVTVPTSPNATSLADVLAAGARLHEVLQRGPGGMQVVPGVWARADAADDCRRQRRIRLVAELSRLGPSRRRRGASTPAAAASRTLRSACGRRPTWCWWSPRPSRRRSWMPTPRSRCWPAADAACRSTRWSIWPPARRWRTMFTRRLAQACRRFLGMQIGAAGHVADDPAT